MKKLVFVLLFSIFLFGCSDKDGILVVKTKDGCREYEVICIEGVAYYKDTFNGHTFPAFDTNGKVKLCPEIKK